MHRVMSVDREHARAAPRDCGPILLFGRLVSLVQQAIYAALNAFTDHGERMIAPPPPRR